MQTIINKISSSLLNELLIIAQNTKPNEMYCYSYNKAKHLVLHWKYLYINYKNNKPFTIEIHSNQNENWICLRYKQKFTNKQKELINQIFQKWR